MLDLPMGKADIRHPRTPCGPKPTENRAQKSGITNFLRQNNEPRPLQKWQPGKLFCVLSPLFLGRAGSPRVGGTELPGGTLVSPAQQQHGGLLYAPPSETLPLLPGRPSGLPAAVWGAALEGAQEARTHDVATGKLKPQSMACDGPSPTNNSGSGVGSGGGIGGRYLHPTLVSTADETGATHGCLDGCWAHSANLYLYSHVP